MPLNKKKYKLITEKAKVENDKKVAATTTNDLWLLNASLKYSKIHLQWSLKIQWDFTDLILRLHEFVKLDGGQWNYSNLYTRRICLSHDCIIS